MFFVYKTSFVQTLCILQALLKMSTNEHESLKTETFVLKIHLNCQGCRTKVRKALRKIEGVYGVDINAEDQKVTVTGVVNPSTLVQKLAKLGKHAEIWNEDYNQEDTDHDDINDNNPEYMIPTFYDKDSYGPEWFYNHTINQHLATPTTSLFYESSNNRANENVSGIDEYPKWQRPASFEENHGWPRNFLGMSSISEYGHQPSAMDNVQGFYHGYHPSN